MVKLFVYGTLRVGMPQNFRLGSEAQLLERAFYLRGFQLCSYKDQFPAVKAANNLKGVFGEIYKVPETILSQLDEYEGTLEMYFERLYLKKEKLYLFAAGKSIENELVEISSGDWKQFINGN